MGYSNLMQSVLIFGRQPALGLAEVESLYGPRLISPLSGQAVIIDVDPCLLAFDRLGGSVKFCKLLTSLTYTDWSKIEHFLLQAAPAQSSAMPEGKMNLGLSVIGFNLTVKQLQATGLALKKAIRQTGRTVRYVPNKELELSTPQVTHNKLTGLNGWELYLIRDGERTVVAQTVKVQDIASYTVRDRGRPKRDSRVGMLPPKLAQILVNLAAGRLPKGQLNNICDIPPGEKIPKPDLGMTVLDPFCGTGVVLQEALIMGYRVYGTDLEPRMIDYSRQNLDWLTKLYGLDGQRVIGLEPADATTFSWPKQIDFIASETYLGRPFTSVPSREVLAQTVSDCNSIIKKFLINLRPQLKSETRLALGVPAWQTSPNQFKQLPLIDQLGELGYTRISFEHAADDRMIYYRPSQTVARELLVLTRN